MENNFNEIMEELAKKYDSIDTIECDWYSRSEGTRLIITVYYEVNGEIRSNKEGFFIFNEKPE
jgi:hypothetical protein